MRFQTSCRGCTFLRADDSCEWGHLSYGKQTDGLCFHKRSEAWAAGRKGQEKEQVSKEIIDTKLVAIIDFQDEKSLVDICGLLPVDSKVVILIRDKNNPGGYVKDIGDKCGLEWNIQVLHKDFDDVDYDRLVDWAVRSIDKTDWILALSDSFSCRVFMGRYEPNTPGMVKTLRKECAQNNKIGVMGLDWFCVPRYVFDKLGGNKDRSFITKTHQFENRREACVLL